MSDLIITQLVEEFKNMIEDIIVGEERYIYRKMSKQGQMGLLRDKNPKDNPWRDGAGLFGLSLKSLLT